MIHHYMNKLVCLDQFSPKGKNTEEKVFLLFCHFWGKADKKPLFNWFFAVLQLLLFCLREPWFERTTRKYP